MHPDPQAVQASLGVGCLELWTSVGCRHINPLTHLPSGISTSAKGLEGWRFISHDSCISATVTLSCTDSQARRQQTTCSNKSCTLTWRPRQLHQLRRLCHVGRLARSRLLSRDVTKAQDALPRGQLMQQHLLSSIKSLTTCAGVSLTICTPFQRTVTSATNGGGGWVSTLRSAVDLSS